MIIPENILFFMSWSEVELRATGSKTVDIAALKRISRYEVRYNLINKFVELLFGKCLSKDVLECFRAVD